MLGMLCPPLPRWNAKTEARRVLLQQVRPAALTCFRLPVQ